MNPRRCLAQPTRPSLHCHAEPIVSVSMEARGDETEVTLCHSGVPDDEMRRRHKDGWAWVLSSIRRSDRFTEVGFLAGLDW